MMLRRLMLGWLGWVLLLASEAGAEGVLPSIGTAADLEGTEQNSIELATEPITELAIPISTEPAGTSSTDALRPAALPFDVPSLSLPTSESVAQFQRIDPVIPQEPLPSEPLPSLPSPDQLLQPAPSIQPSEPSVEIPVRIFVERFEVEGSTVFSAEELATVAKQAVSGQLSQDASIDSATTPEANDSVNVPENTSENEDDTEAAEPPACPVPDVIDTEVNRELSFAELLRARSAITQLYVQCGYVTSGALIPPQTLEGNVIRIQVIEGRIEEINVTGTRRLNRSYIRSRLGLAASPPLNINDLLEGLQLLQLDPLIGSISADLQAGVRPGTSVLQVAVTEADTFSIAPAIDNGRSPSVGSFRRQITFDQANLTGLGDGLSVTYANTDGSNSVDASYEVPVNPRNGTVRAAFGITGSEVIEEPFDVLEIESDSRYYELSYRQPIIETTTEELALGITASRQESEAEFTPFGIEPTLPFPSLGADEDGQTRISAVRLFQEYTQRSSQHVLAFRSQFSLGLDVLDATVNETGPDGRFFAWRGQGQWVRLLAPDTLFLLRGDAQLTPDALVPLEQFGLGGQDSVRGYRQDALLSDNGALLSAEVRVPILRIRAINGLLSVVPFIDAGTAWNNELEDPDPNFILGAGLGLVFQFSDSFYARLDYGIPIISIDIEERTWQENGIYFSVNYTFFP
jgi:hemolysin activation/secretion protein